MAKKSSIRRRWKKVESEHAELFGAYESKRLGAFHGTDYPDWVSDFLAGESKSGDNQIPKWLREDITQSIDNERRYRAEDGRPRIPILVLRSTGDRYDDDIVCIRSDVFRGIILPALAAMGQVPVMSWNTRATKKY